MEKEKQIKRNWINKLKKQATEKKNQLNKLEQKIKQLGRAAKPSPLTPPPKQPKIRMFTINIILILSFILILNIFFTLNKFCNLKKKTKNKKKKKTKKINNITRFSAIINNISNISIIRYNQ